jgi:hypothetical protein
VLHHLAFLSGITSANGWPYLTWSGIVGDIALIGGAWAIFRKMNCEVHGCPRIGRHDTAAGHTVCRKHHPDPHLYAQQVLDDHNEKVSHDTRLEND